MRFETAFDNFGVSNFSEDEVAQIRLKLDDIKIRREDWNPDLKPPTDPKPLRESKSIGRGAKTSPRTRKV